jgi:hypothetical protein
MEACYRINRWENRALRQEGLLWNRYGAAFFAAPYSRAARTVYQGVTRPIGCTPKRLLRRPVCRAISPVSMQRHPSYSRVHRRNRRSTPPPQLSRLTDTLRPLSVLSEILFFIAAPLYLHFPFYMSWLEKQNSHDSCHHPSKALKYGLEEFQSDNYHRGVQRQGTISRPIRVEAT